MIAQQLAGSKVPHENACPEGNTALSLPACRAQTSGSSLPSALPPGHLGLTPPHSLATAPAQGKVGPRASSFEGTSHTAVMGKAGLLSQCHIVLSFHMGVSIKLQKKTVTSDVPERCRRVLSSVS